MTFSPCGLPIKCSQKRCIRTPSFLNSAIRVIKLPSSTTLFTAMIIKNTIEKVDPVKNTKREPMTSPRSLIHRISLIFLRTSRNTSTESDACLESTETIRARHCDPFYVTNGRCPQCRTSRRERLTNEARWAPHVVSNIVELCNHSLLRWSLLV